MANFKKILDHPEKQKVIDKLVSGDTPKDVAQYLKLKFHGKDEAHLRLSANLLKEFQEQHLDQTGFINKIAKADGDGKLDKQIAQSLVESKEWRERVADTAGKEIDLKEKINSLLYLLEARAEQVFDKIQENPGSTKADYVMVKYFDLLFQAIEKADKVINERPDQLVEHTYTVQMVEQHSVAFQEAIRDLLLEMGPEQSARFMELLNDRLAKLKDPNDLPPPSVEKSTQEVSKMLDKGQALNGDLEELQ